MLIFNSQSPFGLRQDEKDRKKQLGHITKVIGYLSDKNSNAISALKNECMATDIGLNRFLSLEGIFCELDPVKENQGREREQRWNITTGNTDILCNEQSLVSEIEKRCFTIWSECEISIDKMDLKGSEHDYYRELRHWITSVTYRLGFFAEGEILFEDELKEYQKILDLNNDNLSDEDDDLIDDLEKTFKYFVFTFEHPQVKISEVLTVHGPEITNQLSPKLDLTKGRKTRIIMKIKDSPMEISPRSFAWLKRKSKTGMSDHTFPPEVHQVANDIRYQAASSINYAFTEDNIKVDIKKPDGVVIKLERRSSKLKVRKGD